uniref:Golgi membrane protein 1 n=1 Tax=Pipistrellus kuhlii TaxID=59472 RepID=A0A7J7YWV9_PIPKU|nr:hypothetical protein mPipKuh1_009841 [Pipistrellus kuhlii]
MIWGRRGAGGGRQGDQGAGLAAPSCRPGPRPEILGLAWEMMGLGNGHRTMKSPPFVLAALVACIIVLGFNYWMASSRSVDLQTRVMELEGRVRRAVAEKGAGELKKNEFQGEPDKIQSSHNFEMESVNQLHQDEKAVSVNNITAGEQLIRTLQDQLKALQKNHGRQAAGGPPVPEEPDQPGEEVLLRPEPVHQSDEGGEGAVRGADRRSHQEGERRYGFQRPK